MPLIFPGATRSKVVLIEGNMFQRLALVDILTLCQYNCVAFETTQKAEAYLISVSASLPPSNSRRRLQKHSQHFPLDNPSAASTGTSKPPSQYGTPEPPHTSHCDASPLSVRSEHRETGSLNPPSNSRDETAGLLESLSTDNDGHARPSGEARTHTGLLPLSSCPIHRSMPGDAGGTVHTADQGNPFVTGSTAFNPESGVSILTQEGDPSGVHRLSLAPRGAHPREYFGPPQASVKRDLLSPVATSFAVAENNCHRSSDDGRHGEPRREGAQTVDASSAYDVSRCPDYAKNSSVSPFSPFSANAQTANHMDGLQDSMMNLSAHDFGMQQATAGLRGWKAKAMLQDTTSEPPNEGLCMDAGHRRRSRLGCQVLCLDSIMGRSKENACTCREPASAEGRRAGEVTKQNRKGQETAPQVEGISNRDTSRTGENDSDLALPGEKREEAEQEDGLKIRSEETVELLLCDRNAPGMEDFGFLRFICGNKDPWLASLPVVVIGASLDEATRAMCMSLGARACLQKPLTLPVIKTLFTFFNVSKRSSRKSKKKSSSDVGRTPTLSGLPSTSRADFSGDVDIRGCNENSFQSNQSSPASHTVISYSHENGRLSSARCSCSEATAQRKPGDDDDDAAYRGEIERDVHSEEEGNDGYWETKPVEQEREEKEQWDCASHERVSDSRHRRRDVVCSSRLRGACLDPVSLTTSDTAASSPLSTSASSPYSPPPRNLGVREPDWKRRDCREGSLPHSDQSAFLWTAGRLSSSSSSSSSLPPSVCISTHKHRACLLTDAGGLCVAKRGREKHEAEDARRRNEHHPIERDAGESVCCRGEKEHPKWLHGCYASSAPGYEQNARRKTIPRIEEGLSSRPEDAQYREEPLASSGRQAGCCEPEKSPSVVISLSALRLSARSLQFVYPRHEEDDSESNFEYEGSSPQDISSLSESYASRCDRRVLPPAHLLRSLDLRCAPPLGFGGERGEGERQRHQMGAPCMDRDTAERGPKGPLVRWKRAEGGAKKHGGDGRYSGEWHDRESVAAEKPSVNLREGMACRQVLPCSIPDRILNLYCDTIAGREANVKDFRSQSSATSPSSCGVRTHQPSVSSSFEIKNGFCAALFQELEPRRERERILDASLAPRLRSPRARLLPSAAGAPHAESETPASRISLLYTRQKRVEETWHSSISSLLHGMDRTPRVRILSQHRLSGGESSFGRSDNSVTDSVREAPSWEPREDEKTARRVVSAALLAKQALLPQPVRSRTDTANVSRQRELEVVRAAGAVASPSPVLPQSVHLQGEARKPLEAMGPSSRTPEQHAEESGSDGESRDERQRVQPRGPTTDEDGLHTGRELGEHRVGTDTDERTRRSLDSEEESDDESDGEDASLSEEEGKGFCVYERVSMIDRGATSNVHLVKRLPDMKAFAHKEILLECMTPAEQDLAKNEVRVLKAVKDPPMIAYVDSWIEPGHTLNIIIEYAPGGSLQTYLERAKLGGTPVPTPLVRKWTAQISVGLLVLHDLRILHRDLKPSNIMLTEDLDVRLCDFGISRSLTSAEEMAETAVGTPFIMSPELCQGKPYNASSDAWALGVILFEMLELRRPFGGDSLHSLFWAIQTEGLSFRSSFEEHEDNSAQRWPSEGGELAKCLGAACETLKGREAHPLPTGVTEQARGGLLARRPVRPVPVLDPEVESERKREREDEGAKREDECRTEPGREGRKRGWDGQLMDEAWQQEQVTRAVNVNARDGRRKTETDAGRGGTNEEEPLDDREALKKLCRRLLKKDPAERPSALDMCTSSVLYADVCAFLRNHRRSDAGHFLRLLEAHRARERSTASPSPLRSDASRPCSLAFSEVSPASTGGRLRALPHRASPARPLTDTVSPASAERRVEKDESRMVASASGGAQKAREESLQMAGRGMSGGGARSDEETGGECAHCEREGRQVEHSRVKGGDGKRGNASTSVMEFYPHLTPSAKRPKYFAGGNTVNTRRGPGELYVVDEGEEEEDEEDKGDEHEENVEEAGDETRARTVRREVGIEEEEEGSETGQRDRERLRGAAVGEAEAGKNPPPVLSEEGRKESSGDTLCEGHTGTLERVYAQPAGLDPSRHSGAIAGGLSSSLALLPCLPLAAKDGDTGREDDAAVCVHPKFSDAKQEPLRDYGERDAGVEIQHGTSSRPLLPFASSSPCLLSSSSSLSSSSASLSSSSLEGASLLFHQRAAPGAHRAGGPSPSSALSSTLDSSPRSPSRSMHACFSHASKPCPLRRGIRCARSQPGRTDMQTGEELPLDPGTDWVPSRDNAKQEEGRFAELRGGGEGTREPGEGPAGSVCLQGPSVTALAYLPVGRTCSSDLAPAGEGQDVDSRRRRKEDRSDRRGNDRGEAVAREHRSFSAGINDSEKRELEVGRKPNAAEELVGGDSAENTERGGRVPDVLERRSERENEPSAAPGNGTRSNVTNFPSDDKPTPKTDSRDLLLSPPVGPSPSSRWMVPLCSHRSCSRLRLTALASPPGSSSCNDAPRLSHASSGSSILPGRASAAHTLSNYIESPEPPLVPSSLCPASPASVSSAACLSPAAAVSSLSSPVHFSQGSTPDPCLTSPASPVASLSTQSSPGLPLKKLVPSLGLTRSAGGFPAPLRGFGEGRLKAETAGSLLRARGQPHLAGSPPSPSQRRSSGASWVARKPRRETRLCCVKSSTSRAAIAHAIRRITRLRRPSRRQRKETLERLEAERGGESHPEGGPQKANGSERRRDKGLDCRRRTGKCSSGERDPGDPEEAVVRRQEEERLDQLDRQGAEQRWRGAGSDPEGDCRSGVREKAARASLCWMRKCADRRPTGGMALAPGNKGPAGCFHSLSASCSSFASPGRATARPFARDSFSVPPRASSALCLLARFASSAAFSASSSALARPRLLASAFPGRPSEATERAETLPDLKRENWKDRRSGRADAEAVEGSNAKWVVPQTRIVNWRDEVAGREDRTTAEDGGDGGSRDISKGSTETSKADLVPQSSLVFCGSVSQRRVFSLSSPASMSPGRNNSQRDREAWASEQRGNDGEGRREEGNDSGGNAAKRSLLPGSGRLRGALSKDCRRRSRDGEPLETSRGQETLGGGVVWGSESPVFVQANGVCHDTLRSAQTLERAAICIRSVFPENPVFLPSSAGPFPSLIPVPLPALRGSHEALKREREEGRKTPCFQLHRSSPRPTLLSPSVRSPLTRGFWNDKPTRVARISNYFRWTLHRWGSRTCEMHRSWHCLPTMFTCCVLVFLLASLLSSLPSPPQFPCGSDDVSNACSFQWSSWDASSRTPSPSSLPPLSSSSHTSPPPCDSFSPFLHTLRLAPPLRRVAARHRRRTPTRSYSTHGGEAPNSLCLFLSTLSRFFSASASPGYWSRSGATGDREARGESRLVSLPVANHRGIGDASGDGAHAKLDTMRGEGREQNGDSDGEDTSVEEGSSFRFEWFCTFLLFLWCARAWLTGSDGGCGEKRKHLTGDWGDAEAEKDPDDRGSRAAGRQVEANLCGMEAPVVLDLLQATLDISRPAAIDVLIGLLESKICAASRADVGPAPCCPECMPAALCSHLFSDLSFLSHPLPSSFFSSSPNRRLAASVDKSSLSALQDPSASPCASSISSCGDSSPSGSLPPLHLDSYRTFICFPWAASAVPLNLRRSLLSRLCSGYALRQQEEKRLLFSFLSLSTPDPAADLSHATGGNEVKASTTSKHANGESPANAGNGDAENHSQTSDEAPRRESCEPRRPQMTVQHPSELLSAAADSSKIHPVELSVRLLDAYLSIFGDSPLSTAPPCQSALASPLVYLPCKHVATNPSRLPFPSLYASSSSGSLRERTRSSSPPLEEADRRPGRENTKTKNGRDRGGSQFAVWCCPPETLGTDLAAIRAGDAFGAFEAQVAALATLPVVSLLRLSSEERKAFFLNIAQLLRRHEALLTLCTSAPQSSLGPVSVPSRVSRRSSSVSSGPADVSAPPAEGFMKGLLRSPVESLRTGEAENSRKPQRAWILDATSHTAPEKSFLARPRWASPSSAGSWCSPSAVYRPSLHVQGAGRDMRAGTEDRLPAGWTPQGGQRGGQANGNAGRPASVGSSICFRSSSLGGETLERFECFARENSCSLLIFFALFLFSFPVAFTVSAAALFLLSLLCFGSAGALPPASGTHDTTRGKGVAAVHAGSKHGASERLKSTNKNQDRRCEGARRYPGERRLWCLRRLFAAVGRADQDPAGTRGEGKPNTRGTRGDGPRKGASEGKTEETRSHRRKAVPVYRIAGQDLSSSAILERLFLLPPIAKREEPSASPVPQTPAFCSPCAFPSCPILGNLPHGGVSFTGDTNRENTQQDETKRDETHEEDKKSDEGGEQEAALDECDRHRPWAPYIWHVLAQRVLDPRAATLLHEFAPFCPLTIFLPHTCDRQLTALTRRLFRATVRMSERSITLPAYLTRYSQFSSPLPLLSAEYGDSLRGSALSGWSSHLASGPSFACPPLRLLSPSSPPLWEALTHFSSPAATLFQGLLPRLSRSPALSLQPCPAAVGPLPSSASSSFSRSRPSGSVGSLACSLSPKKEKDRSVPSVCSPSKGSTPRTKPRSRGGGSEGRADENGATGRELKRRGKRMRCDEMTHGNWTLDGGLTEGEENERNGLRKNEETRIKCRRMCGKCMHFRERENERKAAQTCECRRCWQCASIRGHRQTTGNQTSFGNNGNDWAPYLLGLRGPNVWRLWHENVEQKRREVTESECSGMCIRGKGAWKEGEKGRAGRVSPSCARGGHHHQERRDRELGLLGWILRHTGDPVSPLFAQTLIEHAFQGTLEWTEYEDKALIG